jgi:hypothetical protein
LLPQERAKILKVALLYPEWSSREIGCHVADTCGFTVSESTVYRILKEAGWIQPKEVRTFPAGEENRVKTNRPNQMWQTDATHLLVKRWGWYYLISVLDDYNRQGAGEPVRVGNSDRVGAGNRPVHLLLQRVPVSRGAWQRDPG